MSCLTLSADACFRRVYCGLSLGIKNHELSVDLQIDITDVAKPTPKYQEIDSTVLPS